MARVAVPAPTGLRGGRRVGSVLVGVLVLLVAVQVVGLLGVAGPSWPPLTQVLAALAVPGQRDLLLRGLTSTAASAGAGLLIGTVAGVLSASLGLLWPPARPGLDRLAAILNAVPLIALAPLLITTVGRDATPVLVAALAAGFAVFVAASSGLAASAPAQADVFTALGASRARRLLRLQVPGALPVLVDGLTLAAPAAVLGATLGEWFGAPRGLGVLIVSAMQNFQMDLLWAAAGAATALSLAAYGITTSLQRLALARTS